MRNLVIILAFGGAVAACASTNPAASVDAMSYSAQFDRLETACRERGGMLSATGAMSGRPQMDYACRISGPVSRF